MLGGERPDRVKLVDVSSAVRLIGLPRGHCLLGSKQSLEKDLGRDRSPDNAVFGIPISDVEKSVTIFNFRWLLNKNLGFKQSPHNSPSHPQNAERRPPWGADAFRSMNGLTYVGLA